MIICFFGIIGIIPTRVGTSVYLFTTEGVYGDHPHACGDKLYVESIAIPVQGSSPRVWGQEALTKSFIPLDRIIPTRVGTRISDDGI